MAAFDFPNSPSNGQTYSANGVTFTWNGSVWTRTSASTGAQGAQGAQGHQGAAGAQGAQGTAGSSTTINGNTNNYVVTATGTANTLQGESNLTYDGTNLQLTTDANNEGIKIQAGVTYPVFEMTANIGAGNTLGKLISKWNGTEVASIQISSAVSYTHLRAHET